MKCLKEHLTLVWPQKKKEIDLALNFTIAVAPIAIALREGNCHTVWKTKIYFIIIDLWSSAKYSVSFQWILLFDLRTVSTFISMMSPTVHFFPFDFGDTIWILPGAVPVALISKSNKTCYSLSEIILHGNVAIVGFPNWHESGCHFQEQVGWGTWLCRNRTIPRIADAVQCCSMTISHFHQCPDLSFSICPKLSTALQIHTITTNAISASDSASCLRLFKNFYVCVGLLFEQSRHSLTHWLTGSDVQNSWNKVWQIVAILAVLHVGAVAKAIRTRSCKVFSTR